MLKASLLSFFIATPLVSIAGIYLRGMGFSYAETIPGLGVLWAFFSLYLLLLQSPSQAYLEKIIRPQPWRALAVPAGYVSLYLLYALATHSFTPEGFATTVLYTFLPMVVAIGTGAGQQKFRWGDALFILLIWFPIDFGLAQTPWHWPNGFGRNLYAIPMAMGITVIGMIIVRRLERVGFLFKLKKGDGLTIIQNLIPFLLIAIPFGLFTGFISWQGKWVDPLLVLRSLLLTFFLVALPEELLFRGLIQNLLQKTWPHREKAMLWLASLIFGLAHLNNGPVPDWRYFVLATIAGVFYGRAYNKSSTLIPAAVIHTLVDIIWISYFRP